MAHQGPSRPLRPIAPRMTLQPDNPVPPPAEEGKIKRASTACQECQKRRTKCSEGRPCSECAAHGRECIYNEFGDKRRKVAAKRTEEELHQYRTLLESLLNGLKHPNRANVEQILDVIRSGGTYQDIFNITSQLANQDNLPHPSDHTHLVANPTNMTDMPDFGLDGDQHGISNPPDDWT